jgi:YD repeat-containing protein
MMGLIAQVPIDIYQDDNTTIGKVKEIIGNVYHPDTKGKISKTVYKYDTLTHLVSMKNKYYVNGASSKQTFKYDSKGNLVSVRDEESLVSSYTYRYDSIGRIVSKSWKAYEYDMGRWDDVVYNSDNLPVFYNVIHSLTSDSVFINYSINKQKKEKTVEIRKKEQNNTINTEVINFFL